MKGLRNIETRGFIPYGKALILLFEAEYYNKGEQKPESGINCCIELPVYWCVHRDSNPRHPP